MRHHAWDLGAVLSLAEPEVTWLPEWPTDLDPEVAEQLLGFVGAAIPETFRGPDRQAPFGPVVEVPETASAPDQLAGFLGRTP